MVTNEQLQLFKNDIPNTFKNVRYVKKRTYRALNKNIVRQFEHKILIFDNCNTDCMDYVHSVSFIENIYKPNKKDLISFEFMPNITRLRYIFMLHNNENDIISSEIPILSPNDFLLACSSLGIDLNISNYGSLISDNISYDNNITLTHNIIWIDSYPKLIFNHAHKTISITDSKTYNPLIEKLLYSLIMNNLNSFGNNINSFRNNLLTYKLTDHDYDIVNTLLLKIQTKIDLYSTNSSQILNSKINDSTIHQQLQNN